MVNDNMERGGHAADESSGRASGKPLYTGKSSAWSSFEIKAKSYASTKGWLSMMVKGEAPATVVSKTPQYWIYQADGQGSPHDNVLLTAWEVCRMVDKGEIEPTNFVIAKDGASDWSQMARASSVAPRCCVASPRKRARHDPRDSLPRDDQLDL